MGGKKWENFLYWFISNSAGVKTMFKNRWSSYLSLSLDGNVEKIKPEAVKMNFQTSCNGHSMYFHNCLEMDPIWNVNFRKMANIMKVISN